MQVCSNNPLVNPLDCMCQEAKIRSESRPSNQPLRTQIPKRWNFRLKQLEITG